MVEAACFVYICMCMWGCGGMDEKEKVHPPRKREREREKPPSLLSIYILYTTTPPSQLHTTTHLHLSKRLPVAERHGVIAPHQLPPGRERQARGKRDVSVLPPSPQPQGDTDISGQGGDSGAQPSTADGGGRALGGAAFLDGCGGGGRRSGEQAVGRELQGRADGACWVLGGGGWGRGVFVEVKVM
jgi:hypothetical protein